MFKNNQVLRAQENCDAYEDDNKDVFINFIAPQIPNSHHMESGLPIFLYMMYWVLYNSSPRIELCNET